MVFAISANLQFYFYNTLNLYLEDFFKPGVEKNDGYFMTFGK